MKETKDIYWASHEEIEKYYRSTNEMVRIEGMLTDDGVGQSHIIEGIYQFGVCQDVLILGGRRRITSVEP